jgi:hypothetical protein
MVPAAAARRAKESLFVDDRGDGSAGLPWDLDLDPLSLDTDRRRWAAPSTESLRVEAQVDEGVDFLVAGRSPWYRRSPGRTE